VRTHVDLSRSRRQLAQARDHLEEVVVARTQALTASNARLELAMRHEQALRQLLTLSHAALGIGDYLQQCLERLSEIFGWHPPRRKSAIFLTRDEGRSDQMDLVARIGLPAEQMNPCAHLGYGDCLCGEAASKQRVINVDASHCPRELRFPDPTPRGRIALPLMAGERALGVLSLRFRGGAPLTTERRDLLEAFVRQIALVLDRQRRVRYVHEAYPGNPPVLAAVSCPRQTRGQPQKPLLQQVQS